MGTVVAVRNLTKYFPKQEHPALENIDVSVPEGTIMGIVGPDGAGKTTLLRLMAGLLTPSSGSVSVLTYDTIQEANKISYLLGYMPQKFGLYEDLTVMQNLHLYADLRGVADQEKEETFKRLLQFTDLTPFIHRYVKALSGGMKQKLGLACALIKKPTVLLLDEPSVGVDPISRRELWKMVHQLVKEGITVLWSTAYLDEAERCNEVILLNGGKVLYQGKPHDLTNRVAGRVFKVTNISTDRRDLLFQILQNRNVIDGIIRGSDLHIVVKKPPLQMEGIMAEPTTPRMEDAFVEILGGSPKGASLLAEKTPFVTTPLEVAIEAQHLTKKFGSFVAVDQISFQVKKGEVFGLLGPNGAGKSTTFKMLCGLLSPTSGSASIQGIPFQHAPSEARSHIGYMAQKFSLYGHLNVKQNLDFFSGVYNLQGKEQKKAIEEVVEIFDLQPYLMMSADALPLGVKQRLSLASANMHHPEVLFLDEPTSGVDPIMRREFWNHINGLVGKGVTIMVTTHFMDEAEYCDRIALIYGGKMIRLNTPQGLKDEVQSLQNPHPTLEDAFIKMIEGYD